MARKSEQKLAPSQRRLNLRVQKVERAKQTQTGTKEENDLQRIRAQHFDASDESPELKQSY